MIKAKFTCREPDCFQPHLVELFSPEHLPPAALAPCCLVDHPVVGIEMINGVWILKVKSGTSIIDDGL